MSALAHTVSVEVDEWPGEDALEFAIGLAAQESDPVPGAVELLARLGARLGIPQLGSTRACFMVDDRWVLKVPLTAAGEIANFREATHPSSSFIPLAACRLHDSCLGPALLWMERVTPVRSGTGNLPAWAGFVDCAQVGHTADGALVAYDL